MTRARQSGFDRRLRPRLIFGPHRSVRRDHIRKDCTMKLTTLDELFMHELKDLYDAEHQLVEALPKMAKAATDSDLKAAFEKHLMETKKQITRLKEVFAECDETPERETCEGMKGLVEESEEVIEDAEEGPVLDAALIAAAQKVEHYEIATYGTLITWSQLSGKSTAEQLLQQSLEEEKAADEKLSEIAESGVNMAAEATDEEDEEETATTAGAGSRSTSGRTGNGRSKASAPARSKRARK
jgi:ferritin-like metal-binding protein YciE